MLWGEGKGRKEKSSIGSKGHIINARECAKVNHSIIWGLLLSWGCSCGKADINPPPTNFQGEGSLHG